MGLFADVRDSLSSRPGALLAVYREFLANAARFLGSLRDQDGDARTRTLHTLKGSAAMVGATRLASLASSLQENFPAAPVQAAQAVAALESELNAFRKVIAGHVD